MEKSLQYKDLENTRPYIAFRSNGSFIILKESIENFFNCETKFFSKPSVQIKREYGIDILENPNRGFYPIDKDNVIIIGRVLEKRSLISSIGFLLTANRISDNHRILNKFEGALTSVMSKEFKNRFHSSIWAFGDELIKHAITTHLCLGHFDYNIIRHLIEYFFKLRTTSFEGDFFSTGLIITKAVHDFIDSESVKRNGQTHILSNWLHIKNTNSINRRLWYLADGKKSFFLGTKKLDLPYLFVLNNEYSSTNYLDSHSLALSLKGGDILFKVENEKLLSINTNKGIEFLFFENRWCYRNYNTLKLTLIENITSDEKVIESIIFFLLSCSKMQISSILWFPNDLTRIDEIIKPTTKNTFTSTPVNIIDKTFINHIFRCLSSDGATIIDQSGKILYMGVIVDLNRVTVTGLKGTGESAASALSSNGIAIKISQDGTIKIFHGNSTKPFIF